MSTTAKPTPYFIELCGGRYDGFRQPSEAAPPSTCLEMPDPELKLPDAVADWRYIYEHSRTTVAFIEASPVVTFHFRHVGSRIGSRQRQSSAHWLRSLLEMLHNISRRAAFPAGPPRRRPVMSDGPG